MDQDKLKTNFLTTIEIHLLYKM